MTVDEWSLRQAAKDLVHLYRELEAAKFSQQRRPEVRTMRPSPGPRPPAPDHLVSLDEELSSRLMEYVRDLANHVRPQMILHKDGGRLAAFVVWHAQEAADLPFAEDLMEELVDQIRQLKHRLLPQASTSRVKEAIAQSPNRYSAADAAALASAATGLTIDRKQVTYWGRSKDDVSAEVNDEGVTTYSLDEVAKAAKAYQDRRFG